MMISFIKWKKAVQAYLVPCKGLADLFSKRSAGPYQSLQLGRYNLRSTTHDIGPYSFMPLFNRNQSKTQKQCVTNQVHPKLNNLNDNL